MNASRQSFIVSALLCAVMAALFVARWRLAPWPAEVPHESGMPLSAMLTRFAAAWPWFAAAVAAVVVGWTLLVVVQISIKYAPAASRNYLPPQIFLVCAGGLVISGETLASLLSAWFLALSLRRFAFSFHKDYRFAELFHAGFFLGLIPLLYAPAAVFVVPVAIAALTVYRRSGREAVVCFAGLALPVPAAGFIHWAVGSDGGLVFRELWRCIVHSRPAAIPWSAAAVSALVLVLVSIAVFRAFSHRKSIRKTPYKFICHISLTLAFVAASAIVPSASTTLAALLAVPCSVVIPYAFHGKSAVSTLLYALIAAAVLAFASLPLLGI